MKSGLIRMGIALGALVLGCAAVPASAGTIAPISAITDSNEGPDGDIADTLPAVPNGSDMTFASLFSSWQGLDSGNGSGRAAAHTTFFVPTGRPVEKLELTSNFGVRSDPFNGHARMHKGIDIPGPVGTPVYATADGIVARAQRVGGYGNLIEITHGNELSTRYGHLSKLIVSANERVHRGQLIGLMGSTGRSTGSHLHYEVRVAGEAVNPLPYVIGSEKAMALNSSSPTAVGGPASSD